MPQPLTPTPKNKDVKCFKCGAFNVAENHICGRCGASLPVVYDSEGKVFNWEEAQGFEGLMKMPEPGRKGFSVNRTRWLLRGAILLIAFFIALFIMNARK